MRCSFWELGDIGDVLPLRDCVQKLKWKKVMNMESCRMASPMVKTRMLPHRTSAMDLMR